MGTTEPRTRAASVGDAGTSRLTAALDALRAHRTDLERLGVLHAGVFGSTARGDDRPDSDIDIVLELAASDRANLYDLMDVRNAVCEAVSAHLGDTDIDVSFRNAMNPVSSGRPTTTSFMPTERPYRTLFNPQCSQCRYIYQ